MKTPKPADRPLSAHCKPAPLVGLTGGIACGKSTVARMLARRGAQIIDADQIAREVVAPGTPGLAEVVAEFGRRVLAPDQSLDRATLGQLVFENGAVRARLEQVLHPRIAQESARRIATARAMGPPLVVYDAALLIEKDRHEGFRPLIVVFAPPEVQIDRLVRRDGVDRQAARTRLAAQMPVAAKARLADHVIDNRGALDETRRQVAHLWSQLMGGTTGSS